MKVTSVVLDSVGFGSLPDLLELPHLAQPGLEHAPRVHTLPSLSEGNTSPRGFELMREDGSGKDTSTGYGEFVGLYLEEPLWAFPMDQGHRVGVAAPPGLGASELLGKALEQA